MKTRILLALFGLLALCELSFAIMEEQIGPNPSEVAPKGLLEIVRHPSRVYHLNWSSAHSYYFQATPAEINELLAHFAKARLRDHVVRIEPAGTNTVKSFNGTTVAYNDFDDRIRVSRGLVKSFNGTRIAYNVRLQIVQGHSLAVMREKEMSGSLEPVVDLTIYVGADRSLLQQLKLPDQIIGECAIEGVNLKGKQTKPQRQVWCGAVQFDDGQLGRVADDWEHGVWTRITLWEEDSPDGIILAQVTGKGLFFAAFSEDELAALRQERTWLTMTVGNQGAGAKKDDPRFPADKLVREAWRATPQRVAGPTYYYGRILFEDGTPAKGIKVEFPFGVYAKPDGEGYLQVTFSPEQLAQIKARKPEKNIWCPVNDQGNASAVWTFPASMLSTDKAKAGVVRIPKPGFLDR